MRFKLAALVLAASCLPATAQPPIVNALTAQGSVSAVRGLAHVEEGAQGTYILRSLAPPAPFPALSLSVMNPLFQA